MNAQCPHATEYGCVAPNDTPDRKICNDGIGITACITPENKVAIYYCDIISCSKWKNDSD